MRKLKTFIEYEKVTKKTQKTIDSWSVLCIEEQGFLSTRFRLNLTVHKPFTEKAPQPSIITRDLIEIPISNFEFR